MSSDNNGPAYKPSPQTDGEILPVVDMDDRLVGTATRREIHASGLLHRAVHVLVFNSQGGILLQKRSPFKDAFGGWWDLSVGGHVGLDESYGEAAVRELAEEMGITGAEPSLVAIMTPSPVTGWEHVHLFWCRHDGPVSPPESEITAARWEDPREVLSRGHSNAGLDDPWRMTPSSLHSISLWAASGAPGCHA